jgi:hypothetical protein
VRVVRVIEGVPTSREKVCIPLKGIEGSNPSLSAKKHYHVLRLYPSKPEGFFVLCWQDLFFKHSFHLHAARTLNKNIAVLEILFLKPISCFN